MYRHRTLDSKRKAKVSPKLTLLPLQNYPSEDAVYHYRAFPGLPLKAASCMVLAGHTGFTLRVRSHEPQWQFCFFKEMILHAIKSEQTACAAHASTLGLFLQLLRGTGNRQRKAANCPRLLSEDNN